jgi:hypothetical protein
MMISFIRIAADLGDRRPVSRRMATLRGTPWPQHRQIYPFRRWAGEAQACPARTAQVGGCCRSMPAIRYASAVIVRPRCLHRPGAGLQFVLGGLEMHPHYTARNPPCEVQGAARTQHPPATNSSSHAAASHIRPPCCWRPGRPGRTASLWAGLVDEVEGCFGCPAEAGEAGVGVATAWQRRCNEGR